MIFERIYLVLFRRKILGAQQKVLRKPGVRHHVSFYHLPARKITSWGEVVTDSEITGLRMTFWNEEGKAIIWPASVERKGLGLSPIQPAPCSFVFAFCMVPHSGTTERHPWKFGWYSLLMLLCSVFCRLSRKAKCLLLIVPLKIGRERELPLIVSDKHWRMQCPASKRKQELIVLKARQGAGS